MIDKLGIGIIALSLLFWVGAHTIGPILGGTIQATLAWWAANVWLTMGIGIYLVAMMQLGPYIAFAPAAIGAVIVWCFLGGVR
jgi:hypothetical protein